MSSRDPWAILDVSREASPTEVKSAYRKLCLKHHPDRNQGDDSAALRLQEVIHAYERLTNGGATPGPGVSAASSSFPDLSDQAAPPSYRSTYQIEVSFAQAFSGAQVEAEVDVDSTCNHCGGSGSAPGYKPRICGDCQGTGRHKAGSVTARCDTCSGRGFSIAKPCPEPGCNSGRIRKSIPLVIDVPAGVYDGYTIKASSPGVIVQVTVAVADSPVFKRSADNPADLLITLPISYAEAALGASIKIPTPSKVLGMKIPPGTNGSKPFLISGQGMPIIGSQERGDLYAEVQLVVPAQLSAQQKSLLTELKALDNIDLRNGLFTNMR